MTSPIYRVPLEITSYICIVCGKYHSVKRGNKFWEHYNANARHYGWPASPMAIPERKPTG